MGAHPGDVGGFALCVLRWFRGRRVVGGGLESGVFEVRERAARVAQNPRTLEKVPVPAKRTVKFKVGRIMRDRVSEAPVPDGAPPADSPGSA